MEEILKVIELQRKYFASGKMRDFKERRKTLKRLRKNILSMQNEIYDALYKDLGKSECESYMTEVGLSLAEIRYMLRHGKSYSKKRRVMLSLSQFPSKGYKMPVP